MKTAPIVIAAAAMAAFGCGSEADCESGLDPGDYTFTSTETVGDCGPMPVTTITITGDYTEAVTNSLGAGCVLGVVDSNENMCTRTVGVECVDAQTGWELETNLALRLDPEDLTQATGTLLTTIRDGGEVLCSSTYEISYAKDN